MTTASTIPAPAHDSIPRTLANLKANALVAVALTYGVEVRPLVGDSADAARAVGVGHPIEVDTGAHCLVCDGWADVESLLEDVSRGDVEVSR